MSLFFEILLTILNSTLHGTNLQARKVIGKCRGYEYHHGKLEFVSFSTPFTQNATPDPRENFSVAT